MFAIYKKELRSYFINAIGFVYVGVFLATAAILLCYTTLVQGSYNTDSYFNLLIFSFIILIPLLTMKLFAEEKKLKTEQLLLTAPVSIPAMVFGKFLAAYLIYGVSVVFTSLYFLLLAPYATLKLAVLLGNAVALLLVGLVFISIGIFVSALTENQLSAAIGSIAIILGFLGIGIVSALLPTEYWLRFVFNSLSIFTRFSTFTTGYFDLASFVYYLSVGGVFLYLTIRVFDRRRYN